MELIIHVLNMCRRVRWYFATFAFNESLVVCRLWVFFCEIMHLFGMKRHHNEFPTPHRTQRIFSAPELISHLTWFVCAFFDKLQELTRGKSKVKNWKINDCWRLFQWTFMSSNVWFVACSTSESSRIIKICSCNTIHLRSSEPIFYYYCSIFWNNEDRLCCGERTNNHRWPVVVRNITKNREKDPVETLNSSLGPTKGGKICSMATWKEMTKN